jgi:uncharacterized protein
MNVKETDMRPWYREPWVWALFAGPASVVVAGIVTMVVAAKSNDGVVADDYYRQGLAVNESTRRDARADALGLAATVAFSGRRVRLVMRAPSALLPPSVSLRLVHPTRSTADVTATLTSTAPGVYEGGLSESVPDRRTVVVESAGWRLKGTKPAGEDAVKLGAPA